MPASINDQLNETFHKASVSYMRNVLKADHDQVELQAINQRADAKRTELILLYHEEYDARVDVVRSDLFDKAAQLNLNHPAPPGGGNDRLGAIDREAHRTVEFAHEADLSRVHDEAQKDFEDLLERAHKRNQVHGMARDAFRQVSDRRSGDERRAQRYSQD